MNAGKYERSALSLRGEVCFALKKLSLVTWACNGIIYSDFCLRKQPAMKLEHGNERIQGEIWRKELTRAGLIGMEKFYLGKYGDWVKLQISVEHSVG